MTSYTHNVIVADKCPELVGPGAVAPDSAPKLPHYLNYLSVG